MALIVMYRCPHCRKEHKRALVTKTRDFPCLTCEAMRSAVAVVAALPPPPPEVMLPPVLGKKTRKSRSKKAALEANEELVVICPVCNGRGGACQKCCNGSVLARKI